MVQQLIGKVETHTKEIRDLWGRLNSISVGSTVFPPSNQVPVAVVGAVIVGTALGWGLVPVSVPGSAVFRNVFGVDLGDTAPSYKALFDATVPTTIAPAAVATAGVSLTAAHRDHTHGAPATYPASAHNILSVTHGDSTAAAVVRGDLITGQGAVATWSRLAIAVPAANVRNVLGVDNGDTEPAWKTALDATAPTTSAVGDAAAAGTSLIFSHRDHVHGRESFATNTIALSTAAAAGVATTLIRSDATIAAFDATVPTTIAAGAAAATGVVNFAARRDHTHGAPATYPATAHNILSATHGDTVAAAVVRGDLMVGNSTPAWARVATGAAGSVLRGDGTDTAWTINPAIAGWGRFGSASNPTNTTAGDLTAVRLFAPDIYGSPTNTASDTLTLHSTLNATKGQILAGVLVVDESVNRVGIGVNPPVTKFHVSGDTLLNGYVALANAAPSNTTAGDLTATRLHVGTDGAFTSGYGFQLNATRMRLGGTISDAAVVALSVVPALTGTSGTLQAVQIGPNFTGTGAAAEFALTVQPTYSLPSGTLASAAATLCLATAAPASGATITELYGGFYRTDYADVAGVVTTGYTLAALPPSIAGALKPATQYGLYVFNQGATGITTAIGLYLTMPTNATSNFQLAFDTVEGSDVTVASTQRIKVLVGATTRYIRLFSS